MSEFLMTEITSFPRPRPEDAPFTRPGTSRNWIVAPLCSSTPGTTVRVVNSYAATSDFAPVTLFRRVDFPTDGKPTRVTVPSPDFFLPNNLLLHPLRKLSSQFRPACGYFGFQPAYMVRSCLIVLGLSDFVFYFLYLLLYAAHLEPADFGTEEMIFIFREKETAFKRSL